jgi:succinoglycan biosynthesis transport protein ExoP
MDLHEYPRMLRRRWPIVVVVTAILVAAAWLTAPSSQAEKNSDDDVTFRATSTLIVVDDSRGTNLPRWQLLAAEGDIPERVAAQFGGSAGVANSGRAVRNNQERNVTIAGTPVKLTTDGAAGSITFVTTDRSRERAVQVADALGAELINQLNEEARQHYDASIASRQARLAEAETAVDAAYQALSVNFDDQNLRQRYDVADDVRDRIQAELNDLRNEGEPGAPLEVLQKAKIEEVGSNTLQGPTSKATRGLLGGGLGVLLGLALILMLERADRSIRNVTGAESASQLPVIAEIPYVKMRKRHRFDILSLTVPKSLFAEAYRGLRTSISLMAMAHWSGASAAGGSTRGSLALDPTSAPLPGEPKVILVTSPGPNEGKSTTAANLATSYAGMGSSVIVIDLDFRRQKLFRFFGADVGPHLENVGTLDAPEIDVDRLVQPTNTPGVRFLASAPRDVVPEQALLTARAAIASARDRADVVILDAPPLLLTNDTYDLMPYTDALVLLAREGKTHRTALVRATQLLRRLEAPVIGLVLVAARSSTTGYGYGNHYGYGYGYGY